MKRSDPSRSLRGLLLASCLALPFAGGCLPRGGAPAAKPLSYFGPTDSLPTLVQKINENNQKIPTLWCRFSYDVELHDPQTHKVESAADDDGKLMYRAPGEFRFLANKTALGRVIDMGINDERFWLVSTPPKGDDQMWWGNVGPERPVEGSEIPIRPESLLQVLAVSTFNADLTAEPAPVLRFNNDADAYMLVFVCKTDTRYLAVREVWYDRQTLQPTAVLLFDANGRIALRAYLRNHQPISTGALPAPKMATDYDIYLPESGSKLHLTLRDLRLSHDDAPNDNTFRFPGFQQVPESKAKQIDAQANQ